MDGFFEKGSGSRGGEAKSRGVGRRRGGKTERCHVRLLRDEQGLLWTDSRDRCPRSLVRKADLVPLEQQ